MTTRNRELASIIDDSGNITAGGNLTVSGTTLTASSTVETHADPLIELNTGAGSNSNDLGFVFERGSTGDNVCIIWDESNDGFAVGTTTATGTSTGNMSFTTADFAAGKVTVDNVLINGTTIGHTSDTDLLTLADGLLTVAGEISVTTLDIGGTNVTSTAAELNILDGVNSTAAELNILDGVTATATEINLLDGDTSATGTTLAAADRVIVNDAGTMKQVALSDFETFFESEIDTFSTIDINGGSIDGATVGAASASTGAFTNLTASGTLAVTGVTTLSTHLVMGDDDEIRLGDSTDITLKHHNSGYGHLENTGTLYVDAEVLSFRTDNSSIGERLNINAAGLAAFSGAVTIGGTLGVTGAITGNLTGNASGTAATVTTAAQTNITSLGTLTALAVSGDTTMSSGAKLISTSSSSGDYIRVYASGGTGKWDIYGSGANLRISDNDSAGRVWVDTDFVLQPTKKLWMDGGNDSYIEETAANTLKIFTGGGERMAVSTAGVTIPGTLGVTGAITGTLGTAAQTNITSVGTLTSFRSTGIDDNADALAMVIDSSENIVIGGGTAPRTMGFGDTRTQIEGVDAQTGSLSIIRNTANVNGPYIIFGKSRGGSIGSNTAVEDGDFLGHIRFNGADGTDMGNVGAEIRAVVDGAPGANDTPGKLEFRTTPDGSNSTTTRMTISSAGAVGIARTASQSNTKLEVGGADNVPLIAAEASGVFAGLGTVSAVSGTGLYVGTTLKFAVASTGAIGINGANYGTDGQIFTSGGAGAAAAWEDAPSSGISTGKAIAMAMVFG